MTESGEEIVPLLVSSLLEKNNPKLNHIMDISSFKLSLGQVGAGPGSEQYTLWVTGWRKDRSALFQEIPGNYGAPLNMSTV